MNRRARIGLMGFSLMLCLFVCIANGECQSEDFTGKSWEELLVIQSQLLEAFHSSDGWQEVTVPAGRYQIGIDIPAGRWNIRVKSKSTAFVHLGTEFQKDGLRLAWPHGYEQISLNDSGFPGIALDELIWDFAEGCFFIVENAAVIFTPDIGAPFAQFCNDVTTTENIYLDKTWNELLIIQSRLTDVMWESEEWEQIRIPAGIYEIGVHIPGRRWHMLAHEGDTSTIKMGATLDASGTGVVYPYTSEQISINDPNYPDVTLTSVSWDLKDGMYISISGSPVIFVPSRESSLGFNMSNSVSGIQASNESNQQAGATKKSTDTPMPTVNITEIVDEILAMKNDKAAEAWKLIQKYHSYMTETQLELCLASYAMWKGVENAEEAIKARLKSPRSYYLYSGNVSAPTLDGETYSVCYTMDYGATNSFGGEVRDTALVYVEFTVDVKNVQVEFTNIIPIM